MYSFAFPNMLSYNNSNLVSDKEAIKSNLILLLNVEKRTLFGDPAFGGTLKKVLFEQSNSVISDLLVDEIFTLIATYMPQIYIERRNIVLYTNNRGLFANIAITYVMDNTSDLLTIQLVDSEDV